MFGLAAVHPLQTVPCDFFHALATAPSMSSDAQRWKEQYERAKLDLKLRGSGQVCRVCACSHAKY
jgi:hypothetical protein